MEPKLQLHPSAAKALASFCPAAQGHAGVSAYAAGAAWQPFVEHVLMSSVVVPLPVEVAARADHAVLLPKASHS